MRILMTRMGSMFLLAQLDSTYCVRWEPKLTDLCAGPVLAFMQTSELCYSVILLAFQPDHLFPFAQVHGTFTSNQYQECHAMLCSESILINTSWLNLHHLQVGSFAALLATAWENTSLPLLQQFLNYIQPLSLEFTYRLLLIYWYRAIQWFTY